MLVRDLFFLNRVKNLINNNNHNMNYFLAMTLLMGLAQSCQSQNNQSKPNKMNSANQKNHPVYSRTDSSKVVLKEDEWKKMLAPELYYIARQKGTERPYTSPFEKSKRWVLIIVRFVAMLYLKSDTKFESGCGWPSFYEPVSKASIIYLPDNTLGDDENGSGMRPLQIAFRTCI